MLQKSTSSEFERTLIESVRRQIEEAESRVAAGPERIGRYRILDVLGQGAMGIVYKAEQQHPQRTVALKVMRSGLVSTGMLRRFEKEAIALGRLHHFGIAQIYEGGMAEGDHDLQPFFAMEFVDGLPLTDYCEVNKLQTPQRLELLAKVCDAVEHAHRHNVIHRDLKPSNILVDGSGHPKVLDFGVARLSDTDLQTATHKTETRKLIGTLPYMSPEQIKGDPHGIDERTDVYALGVLGFRVMTGRYPFAIPRNSISEAVRVIQEEEPARLGTINRHLRGEIETIILRAMEKDRARRYRSAAELAADLRRFLRGEPIRARPVSNVYRFQKFARRNKALVGGVAGIMIALSIGLIASVRAFHLATQRLEDFRRLADAQDLERFRAEADLLWPAYPQNVHALESWLGKAEALRPRLMEYRRRLATLHERSLEFNLMQDVERTALRHAVELNEVRRTLDKEEKALKSLGATGISEMNHAYVIVHRNKIRQLEREETELERLIPRKHYCIFDDPVDHLQHDVLLSLVVDLENFFNPMRGMVANVRGRLAFARTVEQETLVRNQAAWKEAVESIADTAQCPQYHGLHIIPQIGLVPLGRDPITRLWEFAHLQSGSVSPRSEDGTLLINEESGLVFVLIPDGMFRMGAEPPTEERPFGTPNVDPFVKDNERPVHDVLLDSFFMSKYEMTQSQWQRVTGKNPSLFQSSNEAGVETTLMVDPVDNVTWDQCEKVLWQMGLVLPTEAQWEYAARAGTTTPWWTGVDRQSLVGLVNLTALHSEKAGGLSEYRQYPLGEGLSRFHAPIGGYLPNNFGLYDVLGNVAEWCYDGFEDYILPAREGDGKRFAGRGMGGFRVIRGGGVEDSIEAVRSSARKAAPPAYRHSDLGVRPARRLTLGDDGPSHDNTSR